ncbi:uncharacterized protein [Montipora capricornis]|uniref:uncharacterized protein isoform X1 n=1 Tax=Montipora capricornis TaxID=246305 RepID=UPI0035F1F7B9
MSSAEVKTDISDGDPPELNVNLPSVKDVYATVKLAKDAPLPVDVLLLTVKDWDFLACYRQLINPVKCWFKDIGFVYFENVHNVEKVSVSLIQCLKGSCTPGGSLTIITNAVPVLRPKAVISVGTCCSLNSNKAKRGDVVVSARVNALSTGMRHYTSRRFLKVIKHAYFGYKAPLQDPEARKLKVHCDVEFLNCGQLVCSETRRKELAQHYPHAIAMEKEGDGAFRAAFDNQIEWLIVKGITDYADGDTSTAEHWSPFASVMAASVVEHILSDPNVFSAWPNHCSEGTSMEYTWEQLNVFRMRFIVENVVSEGLRVVFKHEWDLLYKSTLGEWQDTPQNGRDFSHLEAELNFDKAQLYLSTIKNGNTAEWDCSCLFFAILCSVSIGSSLRPVVLQNVYRLREIENEMLHSWKTSLTDKELLSYVAELEDTFSSLNLSTNELKASMYRTCSPAVATAGHRTLFRYQREQIQEKDKCNNGKPFSILACSPPHEVVRRCEIDRIANKMREMTAASNGAVSTIIITGAPGCGKSVIARQLGERFFSEHLHDVGVSFVATLNAQTLETLTDSYIALAYQLGITEYSLKDLRSKETQISTIKSLLPAIVPRVQTFSSWLVICDNADDLALVNSFLPTKEWGNGQVLITTCGMSAVPTNAPYTYHVSLSRGMQRDDAMELLKLVSQLPDQEEAETVANYLDYQPLALAAAAYYVQSSPNSTHPINNWKAYLQQVSSGLREVTEEALAKVNLSYSNTMTVAVKMAVGRAVESDEVIRLVFLFLSLCRREFIPLTLVLNFVKACTVKQTEESIMKRIVNCSLFCLREGDEHPPYLQVHKVVHEVMKEKSFCGSELKERFQCIAAAIRVFYSHLKEELEFASSQFRLLSNVRNLNAHCLLLLEHVTSLAPVETTFENMSPFISRQEVFSWLLTAAIACCTIDNPQHAKRFSMVAVNLLSYHSEADDKSLRSNIFNVHGNVLQQLCDFKEATFYYEQAFIELKATGEQDRDKAAIYCNLAIVNDSLGRYVEAIKFHKKALSIWKKIQGEEQEQVATTYVNLAIVYSNLGRYVESKEYNEKALSILRKINGEESRNAATSYHSLGITCSNLGQYVDAKEALEKALVIRRQVFGEEHLDVAASYHSIGIVCSNLGQYEQATEFHEKALLIRRNVYGEHPDVAASYHSLSVVCCNLGRYNQAKEWSEKALDIRVRIFGEKHLEVAATFCNLGIVCNNLAQFCEAVHYHEKALTIRTEILGHAHPDVAECYHNLGILYNNLGQHIQAKKLHEKALSIRTMIFGGEHRDVMASLKSLGDVSCNVGAYHSAKELYEKALVGSKKIFGEKHGDVAESFFKLGLVHSNCGDFAIAKELYAKAKEIWKGIHGEAHINVARAYSNLGAVYESMGELHKAKELFEKALVIAKEVLVGEHTAVATLYSKLEALDAHIGRSSES